MNQDTEKLSVLKMPPEERANYIYYQKKLYDDRDELQAAINRDREKKKLKYAKNLLKAGISLDVIAQSIGLTEEEINKI